MPSAVSSIETLHMSASCLVVSVVTGNLGRILPRKLDPNRVSPLVFESSLESVDELMMESLCLMVCSPESPLIILCVLLNDTRLIGVLWPDSDIEDPIDELPIEPLRDLHSE